MDDEETSGVNEGPAESAQKGTFADKGRLLGGISRSLHAIQCHLDNQGSSKLIVDLVIKSSTNSQVNCMPLTKKTCVNVFCLQIFAETVELGIALLEGGNQEIQKSIFKQLTSIGGADGAVGQSFFKVFYDTMIEAQVHKNPKSK